MGKTLSQNTQTSFLSLVSVVMLHRSNRMFASLPAVNFGPVRRTSLRAGKRSTKTRRAKSLGGGLHLICGCGVVHGAGGGGGAG